MNEQATNAAPPPPEKKSNYHAKLQDKDLDLTSLGLPEPMREPFLWLGGFLRNECNRNIDVLEAKIRAIGLNTTGSTIAKIICDQWQKDANGKATAHPILSQTKFIDLVDRLRKQERLAAMAGKVQFIETETWELIRDYIDERRAPERICKFGLIVGPTGSQKTACLKQYALRNNHGACVHIEAPDTPSMSKFLTELAHAYGVGRRENSPEKILSITENVTAGKTIIVDNVQRLYRDKQRWNQPILSFLQKLQDDTGCTIILCCIPESEMLKQQRGYFEQFEGRCGGPDEFLRLAEFPQTEELLQIAQAFKLIEARKHLPTLERLSRTRGRIRVLFNVLQKAKQLAEQDKSSSLSIDHINEVLETLALRSGK